MIRLGAHLSAGKSIMESGQLARDLGLNVVQVFLSSPMKLVYPDVTDQESILFKIWFKEMTLIVHDGYLLNYSSREKFSDKFAVKFLTKLVEAAEKVGSEHVVVHCGSNSEGTKAGLGVLSARLLEVLDRTSNSSVIINLETDCGGGNRVGGFKVLRGVVDNITSPRVRIAVDTAHMFAAGVDWHQMKNLMKLRNYLDYIDVVHINEPSSKVICKGHLDRHDNKIGDGPLGEHTLSMLVTILKSKILVVECRDREAVAFNTKLIKGWLQKLEE